MSKHETHQSLSWLASKQKNSWPPGLKNRGVIFPSYFLQLHPEILTQILHNNEKVYFTVFQKPMNNKVYTTSFFKELINKSSGDEDSSILVKIDNNSAQNEEKSLSLLKFLFSPTAS